MRVDADLQTIIGSEITTITDISVTLDIDGTWNGDLYVYLQHDSGIAILMNRVGRSSLNLFGTSDAGFVVTLNDLGAFSDIHGATAGGGPVTGFFASDGRETDPDSVLDTDPRTALLTNFIGGDANGGWTLFVADMSGGNGHTLNSWSIEVTGVPEPGTSLLLLLSGSLLLRRKR
jgi:subtilisin-like proprotein convertase family protein